MADLQAVSDAVVTSMQGATPALDLVQMDCSVNDDNYKVVAVKALNVGCSAWDPTTGYFNNSSEISDTIIELTERPVCELPIDDKAFAEDKLDGAIDQFARAAGRRIANKFAAKFCSVVNAATPLATFSLGAAGSATTDLTLPDLAILAAKVKSFTVGETEYQYDVGQCALVVPHDVYARILGQLGASTLGTGTALTSGMVPNMFGFSALVDMDVVNADAGNKFVGYVVPMGAVLAASRVIPAQRGNDIAQYIEHSDTIKLAVGIREAYDAKLGIKHYSASTLFGVKMAYDAVKNPNAPRIIAVRMTAQG